MIKKSKFKLLMLSVLLPVLFMGSSISAFAKNQQSENISDNILKEITPQKNKIEEKDGIITINGEKVHYVPDSKIKLNDEFLEEYGREILEKILGGIIKFVKPEELSSDEAVCKLFREGSPHPIEIEQGVLGACAFFTTLSSLADNNPDFIKENLIEYGNDFVIVKFFNFEDRTPIYIMIQKTIPNLSEERAFLRNNCLWVHMYLKGYVAMQLIVNKRNTINYESAIYGEIPRMLWFLKVTTGKEVDVEPWYTFYMKKQYIYKKIEETLDLKGIVLCTFSDSKLCKIPFLKYFFKGIECQGMQPNHAYSVLRTCEDKSGIKWVCCRNPWGQFVPIYGNGGNLYADKYSNNGGYFWLKFKDFYKNCDKIYFSTEKNI